DVGVTFDTDMAILTNEWSTTVGTSVKFIDCLPVDKKEVETVIINMKVQLDALENLPLSRQQLEDRVSEIVRGATSKAITIHKQLLEKYPDKFMNVTAKADPNQFSQITTFIGQQWL